MCGVRYLVLVLAISLLFSCSLVMPAFESGGSCLNMISDYIS